MVTDLIKIPCVKNLVFRDHLHSYPESILNITSHNIIITHKKSDGDYDEIWVRYFVRGKTREKFMEIFYRYSIQIWMRFIRNFQ